ncbi:MAG TPA: flavodoxin family protein [Clostridiaceae bacterium]|nr:flavodoxin family protein [Clostridiaceae bacterium]
MIVIISDDSRGNWGQTLEEAILHIGVQVIRFSADTLQIKPCTACNCCSGKTFGRCIIQDDMQLLFPEIVVCHALVLVSPVIFGNVSHHIKKVMDRMAALGDPRYRVRDGEMVKGMSRQGMTYFMVGIGDDLNEAEHSAFLSLHQENRKIMSVKGQTFILDSRMDKVSLNNIVQEIIHE